MPFVSLKHILSKSFFGALIFYAGFEIAFRSLNICIAGHWIACHFLLHYQCGKIDIFLYIIHLDLRLVLNVYRILSNVCEKSQFSTSKLLT
jgi:hypothetical protein